jgi:hypothetical protein
LSIQRDFNERTSRNLIVKKSKRINKNFRLFAVFVRES